MQAILYSPRDGNVWKLDVCWGEEGDGEGKNGSHCYLVDRGQQCYYILRYRGLHHTTKLYLIQNVHSSEFEKPCSKTVKWKIFFHWSLILNSPYNRNIWEKVNFLLIKCYFWEIANPCFISQPLNSHHLHIEEVTLIIAAVVYSFLGPHPISQSDYSTWYNIFLPFQFH